MLLSGVCCQLLNQSHNLTTSMERNRSWEAGSRSAGREVPRLLWSTRVHCRVRGGPPLVPVLGRTSRVRSFRSASLGSILILFSHKRLDLQSYLFPSGFPTKFLYALLISPIQAESREAQSV
jgi:hypothetical protein